jgi:hypothetical protein
MSGCYYIKVVANKQLKVTNFKKLLTSKVVNDILVKSLTGDKQIAL